MAPVQSYLARLVLSGTKEKQTRQPIELHKNQGFVVRAKDALKRRMLINR